MKTQEDLTQELLYICKNKSSNYQDDLEKIERLIEEGVDISVTNPFGDKNYPAIIACKSNNMPVLRYLIEKGKHKKEDNERLLTLAVAHGNIEGVGFLLKIGVDIQFDDNSAIMTASTTENINMFKYLVEQGADVHAQDGKVFKSAAKYSDSETVLYLIREYGFCPERAKELAKSTNNYDVMEFCEKYIETKALNDKMENDLPKDKETNIKRKKI